MRHSAGESGLPMGLPLSLADATIVQCKGLHIEGCSGEGWYGLDDDFTGDVELSKRTATYSPW